MDWTVFTERSPFEIQFHWVTAILAAVLGLIIFLRRKGTLTHKTMGVIYMILLVITSVSAFFIRRGDVSGLEYLSLKGMTWVHVFIPITLSGVVGGLHGILVVKDAKAHRSPLIGSYIGGMIVAGGLTMIPGRRMHELFFGGAGKVAELAIDTCRWLL